VIWVILFVLILCGIGVIWSAIQGLGQHLNQLAVRVDRLERAPPFRTATERWTIVYKKKGARKPCTDTVECSNEADAVRQALQLGITPRDILSLTRLDT
jgi:hypothetical protein